MSERQQIGDYLVSKNAITKDQLKLVLEKQKELGKKLGNLLVELGMIDEKAFLQLLAEQVNVPFIDLHYQEIDNQIAQKLPENYARRFLAILLADNPNEVLVGMVDPLDIFATDELKRILKKPLRLALVSEKDLLKIFDQIYRRAGEISEFAGKLAKELKVETAIPEEDVALRQAEPSVIKLINSLFEDAMQIGASDIHIEPSEKILRIRMRVDGLLQEQIIPIKERHIPLALAQRLKLMSGLNISEKRLPQDGRFDIVVKQSPIDVRLSTMPTQFGESIVMRLLNKAGTNLDLNTTGMPKQMLARFRQIIKLPHGIILVTGPTGSGKTTTLYGALSEINEVTKNIITIEDPIEYRIERINQVQVNTQLNLTFAKVLRAALRQDPNVILVGEIRDQETASIALRAALTGHLVFATLHTNDAASTALRLIDIGIEGYLVATTLRAVLAQRLARLICTNCVEPYKPTDAEISFFSAQFGDEIKQMSFKHGVGCKHCNNTGFKGRTGVYELLEPDASMCDALRRNDSNDFMRQVNKNRVYPTLLGNAFELAKQGITTLSEVVRIAGEQ